MLAEARPRSPRVCLFLAFPVELESQPVAAYTLPRALGTNVRIQGGGSVLPFLLLCSFQDTPVGSSLSPSPTSHALLFASHPSPCPGLPGQAVSRCQRQDAAPGGGRGVLPRSQRLCSAPPLDEPCLQLTPALWEEVVLTPVAELLKLREFPDGPKPNKSHSCLYLPDLALSSMQCCLPRGI